MATPKEREEQRKQERKREFDRQVAAGSLVVRQMTPGNAKSTPNRLRRRRSGAHGVRAIAPTPRGLPLYV